MKTLNMSLIAIALVTTGATSAFALNGPRNDNTMQTNTVYSNDYVVRDSAQPAWTREGHDRSNYRLDRESRDTLRLNEQGDMVSSH